MWCFLIILSSLFAYDSRCHFKNHHQANCRFSSVRESLTETLSFTWEEPAELKSQNDRSIEWPIQPKPPLSQLNQELRQKLTDVMPPKSKTIPHARLWIVWPKSICKDDLGTNTVECSALQVFCCVTNYQGDFIKSVYQMNLIVAGSFCTSCVCSAEVK